MRRRIALVVIGVGVALLGCAGTTVGQGFQGGLRGSIKDAGGAVAGAAVTLTNEATSLSRSAVTNAEGEYAFASVEPGTYSVKVSMQGYQTAERIGVRVGTQSFLVLEQTLELGTISESVTVSVQTPLVETANAKAPVREVPILADGTHDLKAMAAAGATTGLAFVCNPNNPTGGINRGTAVREFMTAFRTAAPEAYVLVDEAYYDYVTDWSYETAFRSRRTTNASWCRGRSRRSMGWPACASAMRSVIRRRSVRSGR